MLRPVFLALALALPATAQPAASPTIYGFGSADDPLEGPRASFARPSLVASAYAGPTFLGSAWRTAAAVELEGHSGALSAALGGTLHTGTDGLYDPEVDELYDLARLVRYVRLDPRPGRPLYARIGPPQRVTLGPGHLVRSYRTTTAWDERTLGFEAALESPGVTAAVFGGDVRMNSVVGGYASLAPMAGASTPWMRSLRLGVGGVHDFKPPSELAPTAIEADVRAEAFRFADLALTPFASYAQYLNYGRSVGVGADFGASRLADVAYVNIRMAFFLSGDGFLPGYFGPFYAVSNLENRIVAADSFFTGTALVPVDVPLGDVEGGLAWVTEAEFVLFRSFEFAYHFRRHYGDQALSDYSLRLAFRPRFLDGLRVELRTARQGLGSFFSLFSDLKDQNTLTFDVDYPLTSAIHLSIRSRYGYRPLRLQSGEAPRYFLIQRRFEPFAGLRVRF